MTLVRPHPKFVNQAYNGVAEKQSQQRNQKGALKAEALSQIKCNPKEVEYWIKSVDNAPERTPAFAYATSQRL